jgi:hypothetical protein
MSAIRRTRTPAERFWFDACNHFKEPSEDISSPPIRRQRKEACVSIIFYRGSHPALHPCSVSASWWTGLMVLLMTIGGCATSTSERPAIEQPGPGSSGYFSTRVPSDLALGSTPLGSQRAVDVDPLDLEPYLLDSERAPSRPQHAAKAKAKPTTGPAQAPVVIEDAPVTVPEPLAAHAAKQATPKETELYAARETRSQKQQSYQGGDVVVISATTLIVVLLVIVIILLLT